MVVQDLATQCVQFSQVKPNDLSIRRKVSENILQSRRKSEIHFYGQLRGFHQKLAKSGIGIMRNLRRADPEQMELQNELYDE